MRPNSRSLWTRLWPEILITILGSAGLGIFFLLYDQAFPTASLDLKLSRDEISQRARAYVESQGYDLSDYDFTLSFQEDYNASFFLQRTLGVPQANERIRSENLPVWYWYARWFQPLEQEEYRLLLSPAGQVIGLAHTIPEDRPGAALGQDEARRLAEEYLASGRGWKMQDWTAVSASSKDMPGGRTDHTFEWKRRDYTLGDGDLRLSIKVLGDRVGNYRYWVETPEAYDRHFAEQRNRANFWSGSTFMVGYLGMGCLAVVAFVLALMRQQLDWRAALIPGMTALCIVLFSGLNSLSASMISYDTTQEYGLFWLGRLIGITFSALATGVWIGMLWPGAKQLSKLVWPRQDRILARTDNRWAELARSGWRGLMLGGMFAGYVVIFYLVATRVWGGWTPMSGPDIESYASPFPFLGPLETGVIPAMSEELIFRLAGISLVWWLLRFVRIPEWLRRAVALLVPGALWGFAHLSYVRDPFYLRGVELTIAAILFYGLFFLWFDLSTTMTMHLMWNAGLGALPLLRSGQPYFVFSGFVLVAAIFAPAVVGAVGGLVYRRKRRDVLPVELSPVTADDLPRLEVCRIGGSDWAELLRDPTAVAMCLRSGPEIVGAAAARLACNSVATVDTVYVAPAWRRHYRGSQLVDALCDSLRARGAVRVEVSVAARDKLGSAFWASQGWQASVHTLAHTLKREAASAAKRNPFRRLF